MDKQTTIAFVLIGIILVVWLYLNAPETPEETGKPADTTIVAEKPEQTPPPVPEKSPTKLDTVQTPAIGERENERIITIETDIAIIEFSSWGGGIRRYFLKDYKTWYYRKLTDDAPFYERQVQLINTQFGNDLHLIFVTKEGSLVNTADLDFETSLGYYTKIEGDDSLEFSYTASFDDDSQLIKNFVIYGNDYRSGLELELKNMADIISGINYDVVWNNGINFVEENSVDEANYSNASAYSGDEEVVIDASSQGETVTKDINGKVDWIGVRNKYFGVLISPEYPYQDGGAYFEGTNIQHPLYGTREYYSARLKVPFNKSNIQRDRFHVFIGPLEYDLLKSYDNDYEAFFNFGSFFGLKAVTRPISEYILLPLFKFLHRFIPNYGFVIIVFSLIIKFALYPLTKQSYKSMKRMQQLQPKIAELKEKFKDDPQKVQKKTMELYSTYGINPAGGCLPMLLQMPILFALFTFFNVTVEIRHEPFMFWITNLSSPDVVLKLPFKIPLFGIDQITGLAPLLGVTMFLQQKMSVRDPSQKALVYIMPVMFTLMFMGFSSGLNLYYLMFNLFSIIQQYYINHKKGDEELVPVKNPKKKGGFMQRMMDAAEKQAQTQKQTQKKRRK
jgi:YidC/Oxa1 family membrane protein insertase